MLQNKVIQI